MYAQAFALQDATVSAIHNEAVMFLAGDLLTNHTYMDEEQFVDALYNYSAFLASVTATLATEQLLTPDQLDSLMATIEEMNMLEADSASDEG